MKNGILYLLVFFITTLHSCKVDNFNPCSDGSFPQGLLCKEYHFEKGNYSGHIQHSYSAEGQLSRTDFFDTDNVKFSHSVITFDKNKPVCEKVFRADDVLVKQINFEYNEIDSLSAVYTLEKGVITRHNKFEYTNKLLVKNSEYNNQSLANYMSYQYFDQDDRLFKISWFSPSGVLIRYITHEYFINQVMRINHFDAGHNFTGHEITNLNSDGNITRRTIYDHQGKILSTEISKCNTSGNLVEKKVTDSDDEEIKRIMYIYN